MLSIQGYSLESCIHEGNRTCVYRGVRDSDGQRVVLKVSKSEHPSPRTIASLKNEHAILSSLPHERVIATHGWGHHQNRHYLVLEDFGGVALYEALAPGKILIGDFLTTAMDIVAALADVHRQGVIHKDINLRNIVLNPATGHLKLIDFGISTRLSREEPVVRTPDKLEGTLAYLSPEQTGRTNRYIDHRTDFYSLGAAFYHLLTGRPPFAEAKDSLELLHLQLARLPESPHRLRPDIPPMVSAIVMKLLSKNAEDRYQSAAGLLADLKHCHEQWQRVGFIEGFALAARDVSDKFQVSQKLYGREAQLQVLLSTFQRVREDGRSELLLVSGYAGIGKSSLIREAQGPFVESHSLFVSGKFEQFNRDMPYSALIQAFKSLMRQLLARSEEEIRGWRHELIRALKPNAQVLIDLLPELELVIGPQPPVPALAPLETQNRFNLVFSRFIQCFAREQHPLVLFLDDLQWSDTPTLNLLKVLLTGGNTRHLLLIGAHRDNEVDGSHPLMLALRELAKEGAAPQTLQLEPFDRETLVRLCADTLHCSPQEVLPLAEPLMKKTLSNPFFVNQFLTALHKRGIIEFDYEHSRWTWDLRKLHDMESTENVVQLMSSRLRELPEKTRDMLRLAACIGNTFPLSTLGIIGQVHVETLREVLEPAITEGILVRLGIESGDGEALEQESFRFLHDRVLQAAYLLIDEQLKEVTHRDIGRLLLRSTPEEQLEERVFELTRHLNQGARLLTEESERVQLAELNLRAGLKARRATAYDPARAHLNAGLAVLAEDRWERHYTLCDNLYRQLAECEYLCAHFEEAEALFQELLRRSRSPAGKAAIQHLRVVQFTNTGRMGDAIAAARTALKELGVPLPTPEALPAAMQPELEQVRANLGTRKIQDLIHEPDIADASILRAVTLLQDIWIAAYIAGDQQLAGFSTVRAMNLCLKHGNAAEAAFVYALYGLQVGASLGDYASGHEFGKLAMTLARRHDAGSVRSKVMLLTGALVNCWSEPLEVACSYLKEGYQAGIENGDMIYAGYNIELLIKGRTVRGDHLGEIYEDCVGYVPFLQRQKDRNVLNLVVSELNFLLSLQGGTDARFSLTRGDFNEEKHAAALRDPDLLIFHCWYMLLKLQLLFFQEKYEEAAELVLLAERSQLPTILIGHIQVAEFYFYAGLTLAAHHDTATGERQKLCRELLAKYQCALEGWLKTCHPDMFEHKCLLLAAAQAQLDADAVKAMDLYDRAASAALNVGYTPNAAIANHLAARFHLQQGRTKVARAYLADARYLYERWGAKAVVEELDQRYGQLLGSGLQRRTSHTQATAPGALLQTTGFHQLTSTGAIIDMVTVLRAAQTISNEIQLDQLLTRLMQVLLQNAGARRGMLLLDRDGELVVEAEGSVSGEIILKSPAPSERKDLPASIIQFVARTRELVLLSDAHREPQFRDDPYFRGRPQQSILCMPLVHQNKFIGMLYLENDLSRGAFNPARMEVLKVLSSQTAISLENALLYRTLEEKVEERTREVQRIQKQLITQEKLASLGALTAGIAHEIRNPLNFVTNFANLGIEQLQELDKALRGRVQGSLEKEVAETLEDLRSNLDRIREHGSRANQIVTGMMMHAGTNSGPLQDTDLNALLDQFVGIALVGMQANFPDFRPTLHKEYDAHLETLQAFPHELSRVFLNILENACYFLNQKRAASGGRLEPVIVVRTARTKEGVEVRIRDNGPGIPSHLREKIFEPFFTTRPPGSGIGLGLSLAYEIVVQQHHGRLEVQSEEGAFTEFIITLPSRHAGTH